MSEQDYNEAPQDTTSGESPDANAASQEGDVLETIDATQRMEATDPRQEIAALKDQLLRKVAEFENFKRRTREEKDILIKYGTEGLIYDLLPVLDDFERSMQAGREHPDFEVFYKGIEIINGKLLRTLEQRGVKAIEAKGKPFDVDFHDALLQIPTPDAEPGTVIDVIEKGYVLHDKVIRHAKVTVAIDSADGGASSAKADA
jgi:molecular chaperone GrpE